MVVPLSPLGAGSCTAWLTLGVAALAAPSLQGEAEEHCGQRRQEHEGGSDVPTRWTGGGCDQASHLSRVELLAHGAAPEWSCA